MADKKITDLQLISALADTVDVPVDDTLQTYRATLSQFWTYIQSKIGNPPAMQLDNISVACSVASSALTIAIKDSTGSNCSATSSGKATFRNATSATGTYAQVLITGALSTVISSGSTAGHRDGVSGYIYVYLINNAGTAEVAWSSRRYDEGSIVTTVAEGGAGAADSANTIYSTTARTGVALRLIARLTSSQTTAGTWAAVPTEIAPVPLLRIQMSYVRLYTGNGFGSSSTKIRRFATIATYTGTDITINQSASNGDSFTLNTPGIYSIHYSDEGSTGAPAIAISLNSAALTTDVSSLSQAETLVISSVGTGNARAMVSYTGRFAAGDVVRPHTNSGTAGFQSNGFGANFSITKIAD